MRKSGGWPTEASPESSSNGSIHFWRSSSRMKPSWRSWSASLRMSRSEPPRPSSDPSASQHAPSPLKPHRAPQRAMPPRGAHAVGQLRQTRLRASVALLAGSRIDPRSGGGAGVLPWAPLGRPQARCTHVSGLHPHKAPGRFLGRPGRPRNGVSTDAIKATRMRALSAFKGLPPGGSPDDWLCALWTNQAVNGLVTCSPSSDQMALWPISYQAASEPHRGSQTTIKDVNGR